MKSFSVTFPIALCQLFCPQLFSQARISPQCHMSKSFLTLIAIGLLSSCQGSKTLTDSAVAIVETVSTPQLVGDNGRPTLLPLPTPEEIWLCEVVVIGGSLGGVAAAGQAMAAGATTCLIELTPWLGGQISSQGVSAIDESLAMRFAHNAAPSWQDFKQTVTQQPVQLPNWLEQSIGLEPDRIVANTNACWVGLLCFPPDAGAQSAEQWLQRSSTASPTSRWSTETAFKGAEFDATGKNITAIYAVRRQPYQPAYVPRGVFSQEIAQWYAWSSDSSFEKTPIRLQAPAGKRLLVIDATDTGELIGWANLPHRLGSESIETTGEPNAANQDNPQCTQAFTYPFALAIHDDQEASLSSLRQHKPAYNREEHRRDFTLGTRPMFAGKSFFNYRRNVSATRNNPFLGVPAQGDVTLVNWNPGNDWGVMNPPLVLTANEIAASGQHQNWMGGLSSIALGHAEDRAFLFAEWLLENHSQPNFPLTYLAGVDSPMGTLSGLSMTPYIREGRRILGRGTIEQAPFMLRETDVRVDLVGGRDFSESVVAIAHYDLDIHGCRYRNWEPSGEASSASVQESLIRPIQIPLESLLPQGVDNLLIGGKAIAVTHIVNAATRVHYSEWGIGSASGAITAWLVQQPIEIAPAEIIPTGLMPEVQAHLRAQQLQLSW